MFRKGAACLDSSVDQSMAKSRGEVRPNSVAVAAAGLSEIPPCNWRKVGQPAISRVAFSIDDERSLESLRNTPQRNRAPRMENLSEGSKDNSWQSP
jgi:hypothetical protein